MFVVINVKYRKYGISINSIWFSEFYNDNAYSSNSDIIFFHDVADTPPPKNKSLIIRRRLTLITSLNTCLGDVFNKIKKAYRYEIKRSEKENMEFNIYKSKDLDENKDLLKQFEIEYKEFVKLKGIKNAYNKSAVKKYLKAGNIVLSRAFRDGEIYAQHMYICNKEKTRLLYSVSNFRNQKFDKNLVGRANKYLHWRDIEFFKKNNYSILDWGGVSSFDKPNGIDKFKISFGGENQIQYNLIVGKSHIGKLIINLLNLRRRLL